MRSPEEERRIDRIKVCGANRGPHDYIPVQWVQEKGDVVIKRQVTEIMCRNCLCQVEMATILKLFPLMKF